MSPGTCLTLLLLCLFAGTSAAKKKRSTKDWGDAVKNIEKQEMEDWEAERKAQVRAYYCTAIVAACRPMSSRWP